MHCAKCPRKLFVPGNFHVYYRSVRNQSRTHYDILGVKKNASLPEIKNAFYALCKKYHPDVTQRPADSALTSKFVRIKDAYDVLRDPTKRQDYDAQLDAMSSQYEYPGQRPYSQGPFGTSQRPNQSPYEWPAQKTARQNVYTDDDLNRVFEQFRKWYNSGTYRTSEQQYRQQAWEETVRQREDYLRKKNRAQGPENFGFGRNRPFGNFDSTLPLLNRVLFYYLLIFCMIAIFRFLADGLKDGSIRREDFQGYDINAASRRINEMLGRQPTRDPPFR